VEQKSSKPNLADFHSMNNLDQLLYSPQRKSNEPVKKITKYATNNTNLIAQPINYEDTTTHDYNFLDSTRNILGLLNTSPTQPSSFYYEILRIVNYYETKLNVDPIIFKDIHQIRKKEFSLLKNELLKTSHHYNDINLETICRKIAVQKLAIFFGRAELPIALRSVLERVDKQELEINKLGSRTNQELEASLIELQNQYDDLQQRFDTIQTELNEINDNFNRSSNKWKEKMQAVKERHEQDMLDLNELNNEMKRSQKKEIAQLNDKFQIIQQKYKDEWVAKTEEFEARIALKEQIIYNVASEKNMLEESLKSKSIYAEEDKLTYENLQIAYKQLVQEKETLEDELRKYKAIAIPSVRKNNRNRTFTPASHIQATQFSVSSNNNNDISFGSCIDGSTDCSVPEYDQLTEKFNILQSRKL
jgi:hypothetical protein